MKKYILLGLSMFLMAVISYSQSAGEGPRRAQAKERIEAQKVAFITNKLELTSEESAAFWPLYNEFQAEQKTIKRNSRKKGRIENMTDEEVEQHLFDNLQKEEDLLALKRQYFQKMKTVISVRKIAMLQVAEKEFRSTILKKVQERRRERRKGQGMQGN